MSNTPDITPPVRPAVPDMTDRELMEELVYGMRSLELALEGLADNPMLKALMTGQNPIMAMMGRG